MTWVQTYSGVAFDLRAPSAAAIRVEDVAHSLAYQCRFGGHVRRHYSVAQHSVLVALLVWQRSGRDANAALHGLLHDAHEAFTGDVKKPIKVLIEGLAPGALGVLEDAIDAELFAWAGCERTAASRAHVKRADREILFWERDRFMAVPPQPWPGEADRGEPLTHADFGLSPASPLLEALSAPTAEATFALALGLLVPGNAGAAARRLPWPPSRITTALCEALGRHAGVR